MLPLLSFHALVAHRGDGLRPELLALLQRDAQAQMPSTNVSVHPAADPQPKELNSSATIQRRNNVEPPAR
jgi:hypothetical protein